MSLTMGNALPLVMHVSVIEFSQERPLLDRGLGGHPAPGPVLSTVTAWSSGPRPRLCSGDAGRKILWLWSLPVDGRHPGEQVTGEQRRARKA